MNHNRRTGIVVFLLCLFLFIISSMGWPVYAETNQKVIEVNYFYISACKSCHEAEEYLAGVSDRCAPKLKDKNIKLLINKYNTAENDNLNLLQSYLGKYGVSEQEKDIPIVFFGNKFIAGGEAIQADFEKELLQIDFGELDDISPVQADGNASLEQFSSFKVISAFMVGFANGLTPCSLSMLLFFISLLIARDVNIIKMGLLYCAGKFTTYLLLGTLLFGSLGNINSGILNTIIKVVMLTAIAIFICLNALDFFAARNERYDRIRLQLPAKLRGLNHKWIKKVSNVKGASTLLWVSLLLGAATSVGEFLCTGQIYLTTILYVLHSQTELNAKALLYFIEYNLAFITPLLIITFIIYKGKELLDVSEFIRTNMHYIKLINIIIFILLGAFLLFNF